MDIDKIKGRKKSIIVLQSKPPKEESDVDEDDDRPQDSLVWNASCSRTRILIIGDNKAVIDSANFMCKTDEDTYDTFSSHVHNLWKLGFIQARDVAAHLCYHVKRRYNKTADMLATNALNHGDFVRGLWRGGRPKFVRVHFDGGCRTFDDVSHASCGIFVEASNDLVNDKPVFVHVVSCRIHLGTGGNSTVAETCGFLFAAAAATQLACESEIMVSPNGSIASTNATAPLILAVDALIARCGMSSRGFARMRAGPSR